MKLCTSHAAFLLPVPSRDHLGCRFNKQTTGIRIKQVIIFSTTQCGKSDFRETSKDRHPQRPRLSLVIFKICVIGLVLYFCISAFPRSRLSIVFPSKGVSTVQFWNISSTQTAALLTLFVNAADPIDWQRLTMSWTIARQQSRAKI